MEFWRVFDDPIRISQQLNLTIKINYGWYRSVVLIRVLSYDSQLILYS